MKTWMPGFFQLAQKNSSLAPLLEVLCVSSFARGSGHFENSFQVCMTKLDEGPRANFTKMHIPMPKLPMERHVLASGFG